MSKLICIREAKHPAIPEGLVKREFGKELIVDPDSGPVLAHGTSVYLDGPTEMIREWIKAAGGIDVQTYECF